MDETRAEWLARRREFLGASEVAAVCGLDPFKTALDVWASKVKGIDSEDSFAAEVGRELEAPLLRIYGKRTGARLTQPGTLRDHRIPWAACTPDALAHLGNKDPRDVQVKVVGENMTDRWRDGSVYIVPDYTQVQVQWELMVTELHEADVVALLGGTDLQFLLVPRNERLIGYLIEICSRFWRDNVLTGREPKVTHRDAETLGSIYPVTGQDAFDAVPEMVLAIQRRQLLSGVIKDAERERDLIDNTIRLAIGAGAGLRHPGGFVRWAAEGKRGNEKRVLRFMRREPK